MQPGAAFLVLYLFSLAVARTAAPRVQAGVRGWIRHLPASRRLHGNLAALSIFLAQTPILGLCLYFGWIVLKPLSAADDARLAGVGLAFLAASWTAALAGLTFRFRRKRGPRFRRSYSGLAFGAALFLRPLGRGLITCYIPGLVAWGAATLLISHNALRPETELAIGAFGAVLAQGLFLAELMRRLILKRPPWGWARSLPRSSGQRILSDAGMAALLAVPLLALSIRFGRGAWIWAACCLPWLSIRAAAGLRTGAAQSWSVRARIGLEALLTALALALEPRAALLLLGASPLAYLAATAGDRAQKVSLWNELHQLADGDPLSGSGS
jgi:hypothetical protein